MKKVLIVEDDPKRIEQFEKALTKCELFITADTEQAAKWIHEHKFDICFLDHDLGHTSTGARTASVFLPSGKYTGYEVACQISESHNKDTKVIIHTWNPAGARNMQGRLVKAQYLPYGMTGFLEALAWTNEEN